MTPQLGGGGGERAFEKMDIFAVHGWWQILIAGEEEGLRLLLLFSIFHDLLRQPTFKKKAPS